jgi:hypothetical protein
VRLYLDIGFTTYYDIPIEGIVKREKVPADQSPLGVDSSLLFVLKDIKLVVHHSEARSVEEEFLSGDFTAPGTFTPAAGAAAAGGPGLAQPLTAATVCTQFGCQPRSLATVCTQFGPCPTHLPPCGFNTRPFICTELCPVSRFGSCASRIPCVGTIATVNFACRPSLGIACTIQGCNLTVAGCPTEVCTIHPTIWTQIDCPGTIHPTLWTQIECQPLLSRLGCPSLAGCPSIQCGGQGDPGGPVF